MADEENSDAEAARILAEYRRQLADLCSSKRTRTSAFSSHAPTDWNPETVINIETAEPFTESSAWLKIQERLLSGCPIEVIELRKPQGAKGFVLRLDGENKREIYVKLQFGNRKVIGRSFHYSYRN